MGENKDYITSSDELGSINVSEEVLSVIAAAAAMEQKRIAQLQKDYERELARERR